MQVLSRFVDITMYKVRADMGTMPNIFPGYQPVANDEIRAKFEKAWGVTIAC